MIQQIYTEQWRIQDFPEVRGPTLKVDVKSYYLANFFPKNCMKLKKFGPERAGGACPWQLTTQQS